MEENVIQREADTQTCPICAYEEAKTLAASRIREIESWIPTQEVEAEARQALQQAMGSLLEVVKKAVLEYDDLLPPLPSSSDFEEALKEAGEELQQAVKGLRKVREEDDLKLGEAVSQARDLFTKAPTVPASGEECEAYVSRCAQIVADLENMLPAARQYRDALRVVETAAGAAASVDPAARGLAGLLQ